MFRSIQVRVTKTSVIKVGNNRYSVPSRLIGEWVKVHQYADCLKIFYADRQVQKMPRLRGENKHDINYRHVIHSLVRKPGAFENYKYRDFMFPSSNYRRAYDALKVSGAAGGVKNYLQLLQLAAQEGEELVEQIICARLDRCDKLDATIVKEIIEEKRPIKAMTEVVIDPVDLRDYDLLLEGVH